jgi:hypothetical protein
MLIRKAAALAQVLYWVGSGGGEEWKRRRVSTGDTCPSSIKSTARQVYIIVYVCMLYIHTHDCVNVYVEREKERKRERE